MQTPQVAIVILNWNGKKYLEQFLPSVISSTYANKRVIVADNASTDESVAFLRQHYPQVEIILLPENFGFAGGYNQALKQVESDYYVLLNSDVEVSPGWIEPVVSLMESNRKIAACQPKLLAFNDRSKFEYAGACGGWIDRFGYPFARGRVLDICEVDKGQYDEVQSCFWASGAAMFIRAELYHQSGGLDTYFFAHQEEIDLCWRLQLMGYQIFSVPSSVVYHVGGGTLPKGNSRKVYLNFRNNLIMLAKNLSLAKACYIIPIRFCLDALAAWKSLFSGDVGYWLAVAKSHMDFMKWLIFVKRTTPKIKKLDSQLAGYYSGSLLWEYFIKKKQQFAEIISAK